MMKLKKESIKYLMKTKLFADETISRKISTKDGDRFDLPEGIYTIRKKACVDGTLIDSFAPATRYNDYKQKLIDAKADWEDMVGLDRGFLTEAEHTAGATATEIRTANTKTRSFVKKIQSAMFDGIKSTLEADSVFLNIPLDLYTVAVDWFDAFQDETELYNRIVSAVDRGILEKEDEFFKNVPGVRSDEWCGAELIFRAFPREITCGTHENIMHEVVRFVDDHDRFIHELDGSREFLSGSMLYPESQDPGSLFWIGCLHSWEYLYDVIGKGETVSLYKKNDEERSLSALGFERELILKSDSGQRKALKVYCINRQYNSDIFGDKYYEYPIVCTFTYNGRGWKYSLYSSRKDACCGKIAQAFSPAGGGHNGAAGFTRSELIFNKLTVVTPPIKADLEEFFREFPCSE